MIQTLPPQLHSTPPSTPLHPQLHSTPPSTPLHSPLNSTPLPPQLHDRVQVHWNNEESGV